MDKQAKRARIKAWQSAERAVARAALPLADDVLAGMFRVLETELAVEACDHTRRRAEAWLHSRGCIDSRVVAWLDETGGYCVCEVLSNSMDAWIKATRR